MTGSEILNSPLRTNSALRKDMVLPGGVILAGVVLVAISLIGLNFERQYVVDAAQASRQAQMQSPSHRDGVAPAPAVRERRPQDVAPQPARPDAEAQKTGAKPALPPAPAEKSGEPIPSR